MSRGVKVTLCGPVAVGAVAGEVKAKPPGNQAAVMGEAAEPPVSVDEASVCPVFIGPAVGHMTVGVALFTSTPTVLLTEE